jgi:dGTPase
MIIDMNNNPDIPSIWSQARRPRAAAAKSAQSDVSSAASNATEDLAKHTPMEHRSVFQQDYDRLLFSTPVRRLADKTQVWPMDENDGVRTRLTHSHEVANLARSIGTRAYMGLPQCFIEQKSKVSLGETIQPLLLAAGLGHDLGNPPFGHQGEAAISTWFKNREDWIFSHVKKDGGDLEQPVPEKLWPEFTDFDGNPQTLRLLSKLQTHIDGVGLDLSAATLAVGLKYSVCVSNRIDNSAVAKKAGYFESEKDVVSWIREKTNLKEGQRHPLTWIMEACDDIAYSVLDVDDVLKKGIMSPDDVFVILRRKLPNHPTVEKLRARFDIVENKDLVPEIQRDIKIQYLRALLIEALIDHASTTYINSCDAIFSFEHKDALMDDSPLCEQLKEVARLNAFSHSAVLRAEAMGAVAIDGLMSVLWEAISERKHQSKLRSKRLSARAKYVFSLISPNYIEQAVVSNTSHSEPASHLRYCELRLLTDMVSGMTDTFAIRLWNEISAIPYADRT